MGLDTGPKIYRKHGTQPIGVYQKLDLLDMDTWQFFLTFITFMGVSYIICFISRRIIGKINNHFDKIIFIRKD